MGKTSKAVSRQIIDSQDYPISKKKTRQANLNSYIRMLKQHFSKMSSKQFIKNVHRFIQKINGKKSADQQKLVQARQAIKICRDYDRWSINKQLIQCVICQDNYHQSCLKKNVPGDQRASWCCQSCSNSTNEIKNSKNQYFSRFSNSDDCAKCEKVKKQFETFIVCFKCNDKYHKQCYGKSNVVCQKCDLKLQKQIKEKQASLFDYIFQRKTQTKKKQASNQKKLKFGFKYQNDQSTQASVNPNPTFNKNFPEMSQQQIDHFKNSILYAIRAKQMIHVEELMPIDFEIFDDNEQTLDFGLMHMSPIQLNVLKTYKARLFGPFEFEYKQNMGYDVKAAKDLPKGMLVCEYGGDVVPFREIVSTQTSKSNDSLFELRVGHNADQTLYIRPQKYTNIGRFINGVNNITGKSKINTSSVRLLAKGKPGIFLNTTKKILKGQNLAYDYNVGGLQGYNTEHFF